MVPCPETHVTLALPKFEKYILLKCWESWCGLYNSVPDCADIGGREPV